jgi:hypothetical protein
MAVIRVSRGRFELDAAGQVVELAAQSETVLRPALEAMPGLLHYFVGVDVETGAVVNVNVWDTLEHAKGMASLPAMLALRPVIEEAGVTFEPISSHEIQWEIEHE